MRNLILVALFLSAPAFAGWEMTSQYVFSCKLNSADSEVVECYVDPEIFHTSKPGFTLEGQRAVVPMTAGNKTTLKNFLHPKLTAWKAANDVD